MPDIIWPDDLESTVDMMKDKVSDHHSALYGNGKEGLLDFIAGIKAQVRMATFLLMFTSAASALALVIVTLKH